MIKILLFAQLAEKLNQRELNPGMKFSTVQQLLEWMGQNYPQIEQELQTCMTVLNEEYCDKQTKLSDGDVVAIIPPVSGG